MELKRTLTPPGWIYVVIAFLVSSLVPTIFYILYSARGSIVSVLLFSILVPLFYNMYAVSKNKVSKIVFLALCLGTLIAVFLLIVTLVTITTTSSYLAWFSYVGTPGGGSPTLSYYFVIKLMFFSSITSIFILRGNISGSLALLLFLIINLLAVMYSKVWLSAIGLLFLLYGALSFERKNRGKWTLSAIMPLIQVMAVSIILALIFGGAGNAQPRRFSLSLMPRGMSGFIFRLWPDFPLAVDIPGFGGIYGTRMIDGVPAMSTLPIFEIKTGISRSLHIKTQSFDRYKDSAWTNSSWMLGNSHSDVPVAFSRGAGLLASPGENDILMEYVNDFYSTVPHTLQTREIAVNRAIPEFEFEGIDVGYIFAEPFRDGTRFMLHNSDREASTATDNEFDFGVLDERARENYLQVSSGISLEVIELAQQFKNSDPRMSVQNIQRYFNEEYNYSLNYPRIFGGEDVVNNFLTSAESGYCVQFASAMTILLRILEIPSRYVTGFYVIPAEGRAEITGMNAHAWTEAWFDGEGWVTIEATPPMLPDSIRAIDYYSTYNPYEDSLTARQLNTLMRRHIEPPDVLPGVQSNTGDEHRYNLVVKWAARLLVALILLLPLSLIAYILLPIRLRFRICTYILTRLCRMRGFDSPQDAGWLAVIDNLSGNHRDVLRSGLPVYLYSQHNQTAAFRRKILRGLERLVFTLLFKNTPA